MDYLFNRRIYPFFYIATVIIFMSLILFSASGPRGSDQFWYVADTATLMEGQPPISNTVYPGPLLRNDIPIKKNYFAHNTPVVHMAAFLAKFIGKYRAWIFLNIFFAITAAFCISKSVNFYSGKIQALLSFALFLFLPLTFWQTANVLQEIVFCSITAILMYLFLIHDQKIIGQVLLLLISAAAIILNPFFIPIALILPLYLCIKQFGKLKYASLSYLFWYVAIFALFSVKGQLFPSSFPPSLKAIILSAIPGMTNMEWHLSVVLPELSIELMLNKIFLAFKAQLPFSALLIYYIPTNIGFIACVYLLFTQFKSRIEITLYTIILIGLYIGLICCHQNQFRYQLMITPPIIVCIILSINSLLSNVKAQGVIAVFAIIIIASFLLLDLLQAKRIYADGKGYNSVISHIQEYFTNIPLDENIIIDADSSSARPLAFAYAVHPRKCLIVEDERLDRKMYSDLSEIIEPDYVFAKNKLKIQTLHEYVDAGFSCSSHYDGYKLYRKVE